VDSEEAVQISSRLTFEVAFVSEQLATIMVKIVIPALHLLPLFPHLHAKDRS